MTFSGSVNPVSKQLGVIGEALVDVVISDTAEQRAFPGGSPLNVAVGLAKLGHDVFFAGRWGRDEFGDLIDQHVSTHGVKPVLERVETTSVARAYLDPSGVASYEFDLNWEVPETLVTDFATATGGAELDHAHVGSIGTVLAPGAATVLRALTAVREHATISYDPNCRPTILPDRQAYRQRAEQIVGLTDIVHASDEDLTWLYPHREITDSLRDWAARGPGLVIVTRGARTILGSCADGEIFEMPIVPVQVADTVGAGDSFTAALLWALHQVLGDRAGIHRLSTSAAQHAVRIAAHASAITSSRPGANPPETAELLAALQVAGIDPQGLP